MISQETCQGTVEKEKNKKIKKKERKKEGRDQKYEVIYQFK